MYKVMVVDDESWGRKSISKMISELALELEVIAEARHGEEALDLIRISKPHIVVTDMNMPVMNGQDFLARLHADYNEIKVIVISGYSEFEYLKAALTYSACEYVLKPVSATDLRMAMAKAIEASKSHLSLQQQKKHTEDVQSLKREVFLQHVASGRINNVSDIYAQAEKLGITYAPNHFRIAILTLRQYHQISEVKFHGNADLFMFCVENILLELLHSDAPLAFKTDDRERIVLIFPESAYDHAYILSLLQAFQKAMKTMFSADVLVGLSSIYAKLDRLSAAFEAANEALLSNLFHGTGLSIFDAESFKASTVPEVLNSFEAKALKQALASYKTKEMNRILDDLIHKITRIPNLTIHSVHRELANIAKLLFGNKGTAASRPVFFEAKAIVHVLEVKELVIWLDNVRDYVDKICANQEKSDTDQSIRDIVRFLDQHYFEDLSLVDVATRYHIDPSYLSKLFKIVTGENFIEYISRKRIEKACELLSGSDRKIIDISELVGYENQRYFSQVFRKMMGQTPSEFRESSMGAASPKN